MKLLTLSLFAFALLAQADQKPAAVKEAPAATSDAKPVDKDLATIYESYGIKVELVQRRAKESVDQLKKNVDETVAQLQKDQEPVRLRICKAASLPDTCVVGQDPKTGEWTATPAKTAAAAK